MNWRAIGAAAGADAANAMRAAWVSWLAENRDAATQMGEDAAKSLFCLAALEALQPDLAGVPSGPREIADRAELLALRGRLEEQWSESALAASRAAAELLASARARVLALVRQVGAIGLRALVLILGSL